MRPFEFLLLVTAVPFFLWPLISKQQRPLWNAALPFLALLFLIIHLVIEGYRWQMLPAYGLTAVLFLYATWQLLRTRRKPRPAGSSETPVRRRRIVPVLLGLTGLLATTTAAILPVALPVPRLLKPTGPYAIGTVTYYWIDDSRQEQNGPTPGDGPRELMVQLWYPALAQPDLEPLPWHPDIKAAGPALANTLDMPSFLLDHLVLARTHSLAGVPLAGGLAQYPVLIFSHGLGGVRMQNTFQMEELASHGFIIAAIDHTYGGAITIFPDGRVALFDPSTLEGDISLAGNRLIHIWMEDGRFVLDQLEQLNANDPDNRFTGRLNLEKIGYFGHSTGGGTAFLFCQIDERCGAGIALDGWLEPLAEEADTRPITRPFLFLKAENWSTPENSAAILAADEKRQAEGTLITLPGTGHYNFSDLPLLTPLTPQMGLTGSANGRETLEAINAYTLSFFNQHLPLPR